MRRGDSKAAESTRPTDFTQRLEELLAALNSAGPWSSLAAEERVALTELIDVLSVLLHEEGDVEASE